MDLDVLDGLAVLEHNIDGLELHKAVEEWPVSVGYTKLVEWLSKELKQLCKMDEHVNAIATSDDSSSFLLELSSFLKELGCSYKRLTEGNIDSRLKTSDDRYLLLDYLITELLAARILIVKKPTVNNIQLTLSESKTAASMKKMLMALNFPKPPTNITAQMLFSKVQNKVKELPDKCINEPLFSGLLSPKQWETLSELQEELKTEYGIRRQLLLKRLDVTIQSFKWSERIKGKENEIAKSYVDKREVLSDEPGVKLSDLLAARIHLAILEKTSNSTVRKNTKSNLNSVIIGQVPDRGGRPQDQQPPPPEMPSWAPRAAQPQGFGGGGGGNSSSGRGRGGRVQGGWNSGSSDNHQGGGGGRGYQGAGGNYHGGGGGYHQGSGNYYQGGGGGYQGGGYQSGGSYQGVGGGGRGGRGGGGRGRDRDRY